MSIPALRRLNRIKNSNNHLIISQDDFMILTLKNGKKLVITSDSYHGIISSSDLYKCVLCNEPDLKYISKEIHKNATNHKKLLALNPHNEEFAEHLIRQLDNESCYCSICNVLTSTRTLTNHLASDGHTAELKKAKLRSFSYQPVI